MAPSFRRRPAKNGLWWARDRNNKLWTIVEVTDVDDPDWSWVYTLPGYNNAEGAMLTDFDRWVGPLELPQ